MRISAMVNTRIGSSWTRGSVHRERSASDAGRGSALGGCFANGRRTVDVHAPGPGRLSIANAPRYSRNAPDGDGGLQTVGSSSQATVTAALHCFLHVERSLPDSPPHSAATHAAISSLHALLPHTGGAATASDVMTTPPARNTPNRSANRCFLMVHLRPADSQRLSPEPHITRRTNRPSRQFSSWGDRGYPGRCSSSGASQHPREGDERGCAPHTPMRP